MKNNRRLFLMSNSHSLDKGFLEHAQEEIKEFLKEVDSVLFIPYALADKDGYAKLAQTFFQKIDKKLVSIHNSKDPSKALAEAKAVFVGGGNTFRLLNELYKRGLLDLLRKRIGEGIYYVGSSAGSNIAAPTIKTTNDMPIIQTPALDALNVISFQINPHYFDSDPAFKHMGESREQRIHEYHEENNFAVVGLREGAWLVIEGQKIKLGGQNGAKVFQKNKLSQEYQSGSILNLDN